MRDETGEVGQVHIKKDLVCQAKEIQVTQSDLHFISSFLHCRIARVGVGPGSKQGDSLREVRSP